MVELVTAGGLLTARRSIVEKLTDDSAPQISASEVTYNSDQGTSLIKFKTFQGDSKMTNWEICGWIVFALGMIVLAKLAIRSINRVI